ncbi:MAG: N-acetyltransferase, partial [Actinomycetia bacterium]|nr:N-acetyltransferase [Actinomycetes bacterium]
WPPFGLRVETGDLVLTVLREGDIPGLVELVLDGIHDPEHMPFLFPWTDAPPGSCRRTMSATSGECWPARAGGA